MPKKKFSAVQIVTKLRQVEVLLAQGNTITVACKEAGTTEQSSAMNASMARSSTVSRKPKWSLRNGASTTTPNVHIHRSAKRQKPPLAIAPKPIPLDERSNMQ